MPRINRYDRLPFENLGGGVDEGSPPRKAKFRVCENVRDSAGGTSKIKRPGLTKLDSVYDFGTKNVYGCFGIGEIDAVKQLALVEDDVRYKTGGEWSSIFTPTATIDVPVSVVKDKGLTIVAGYEKPITVMAGAAFYSGIVAPVTLMEVHPEYPTTCDAEDFAAIGDWVETQAGNMHASQATFETKSCLRFLQGGTPNVADYSSLAKSYGAAPGKRFCVKTSIHFNTFQHASKERFSYDLFYSATECFAFSSDGYVLTVNNIIPGRIGSVGIEIVEDKFYDLEFYVDTEDGSCDVWITPEGGSRAYYGNYAIDLTGTGTAGDATIYCSGHYVVSDVYLDYMNVYNTEKSGESGAAFGYGCTYRRGGNYPCESNPIESIIGSAFHYGTGLSDLTPGGLYVGTKSRTIQVQIDGTGTPDTVKISYDGGNTWHTTDLALPALSPVELVTNGDFGDAVDPITTGWIAANGAVLTSEEGGQAENCLMVTGNAANNPFAYQAITVKPNTHYHFSFYEKNGTENEYRARIYDATNEAYLTPETWLAGDAAWTQGHVAFYTSSNCKSIWIVLQSRSQSTEAKTFYFDTVTLYEAYVMDLNYGITLGWGYSTGHTLNNFWSIPCQVSACRKHAEERTEITGIPTPSESEVDQRRLWRTYADLAVYYWLVTLNDKITTTYSDRHSDAAISGSDAVSYESYPPPAGEDCEIWDDKLWVTRVPEHPEALFYSRTGKLEQFPSPAESYFPLREDETDENMKTIEFNNNLYTVKVNSVWILTKSGTSYRSDKIVRHTGTAAKGSVVATDRGIMMLTNHYKIGVCDGWKMILPKISDKVKKTLATINKDYAYRSTSGHDPDNKIYYLSIPTGANEHPDTTIAFYYEPEEEKFFIDKYHQNITSISLTDVAQYQRELLFGTKDGEVYKLDPSATTDDGTIITSKFRTGLIGNERWKRLRRMFLEYYVPSEIIIEDNFNDNNLTGWTTSGGVAAANQRLEVTIVNGGADYIRKSFAAKKEIFGYFKLYVNTLTTWVNGNYIDTFGHANCGVGIRNDGGTTKLRAWYKDDAAAMQDVSPDTEILTGLFHRIKVHWKAASAVAANDGIFKVWLDGILVVNVPEGDCDTDTITASRADFGNVECSAGVYASLWIDDVRVSVDTHTNLKIFKNVKETAALDKSYPGKTPSGGDTDLREFIQRTIKLGIPGQYFSFEFGNDEDVSGWEVMSFILYGRSRGGRRTITPS